MSKENRKWSYSFLQKLPKDDLSGAVQKEINPEYKIEVPADSKYIAIGTPINKINQNNYVKTKKKLK